MMCAAFFRRREIWLPTIWGWLALLLIGAATIVQIGRAHV